MNPLLIFALAFLQTLPVANEIRVGSDFIARVEYGTIITPAPDTDDTVLWIASRYTTIVLAHNGLSGTEFHDFQSGEKVYYFDREGDESHFILTKSWVSHSPMLDIRKLSKYKIVFVTCNDASGESLLLWAGQRVQ